MSVPDWVTISLGVVSPLIAAFGAATSWRIHKSQRSDARAQTIALQRSLAASILGDLRTAKMQMQDILSGCNGFGRVTMANSGGALSVIRKLASMRMPTIESLRTEVATFDPSIADPILQATACLDRVRHISEKFAGEKPDLASLTEAIEAIATNGRNVLLLLEAAENAASLAAST